MSSYTKMAVLTGVIATPIIFWMYRRYETSYAGDSRDISGAPGEVMSLKSKALDTGAAMVQRKDPLHNIHATVCGIHMYSGEPNRQVIAHHYCAHLNEDVRQCLVYDSDQKNARLIGVEYIISPRLFEALDEGEKKYWHSHGYEVKSGTLVAPGLPLMIEHKLMEELAPTYGKTFHFWQIDRDDPLPLGPPKLMMALSEEVPADPVVLDRRDRVLNINTSIERRNREDIPKPPVLQGADHWRTSKAMQLFLGEKK